MVLQLTRTAFTVNQFQRMGETGILKETDRHELLNGEIITMSPIGHKHAGMVNRLNRLFTKLFPDNLIIAVQNPIELGPLSQPQPDIAILRDQEDCYVSAHPTADDIYLLIEVADSTLETDRNLKLPIYAEAGIQETWIVNLRDEQIEVYREPIGNQYTQTQIFTTGQTLTISAFPEIAIECDRIFR